MIAPTANYPTSRNYTQLWELAHTASIVCIVDMEHGKPGTCRDITRTAYSPEWSPEVVQVGSRGIGHVWAESLEAFIAQCEHCNLEWLVPPQPVAVSERLPASSHTRFEFSVFNDEYEEQAGGSAPTYAEALGYGEHCLAQYRQDGPHALELRRVEVLAHDTPPTPPEAES